MIGLAVIAWVLLAPASALAQDPGLRDPFDPLLSTEDTTTTAPTEPDTSDPTTVTEPDPDPGLPTDGLPTTGQDPSGWLAVAYLLVASGGALLALPRLSGEPRRP